MNAQPDGIRRPSPWSPQDDAVVRANHGRIPNRRIGQALGRTASQVAGRARALGLVAPVVWTEREVALLRAHYRGDDPAGIDALVAVTGKARHQVRHKARALGLARAKERRWTKEEEFGLSIMWGRQPDEVVARRLGRTVNACKIRTVRVLRKSRKDGLRGWTGRGLARLFGVDEHKVTRQWVARGWLVARETSIGAGANRTLLFEEEAVVRFLRTYPQEYDRRKLDDPSGYYRRIAREAWEAAGLVPIAEAAARVGMSVEGLRRHVRRGWLPGVCGHTCGGGGVVYVRAKDLATWKPRRPELVGRRGRAPEDRHGPRRESAALRAAGIAWWRTWTPACRDTAGHRGTGK